MKLSLPPSPDKPSHLRAFALGPLLHEWSSAFQPQLLNAAADALTNVQSLITSTSTALAELHQRQASCLFSSDEDSAEEFRLTCLLERQVSMLEKLGNFHARTTSVSAAALLHAMTRGSLASGQVVSERNATPRRTLGSAADQVIEG